MNVVVSLFSYIQMKNRCMGIACMEIAVYFFGYVPQSRLIVRGGYVIFFLDRLLSSIQERNLTMTKTDLIDSIVKETEMPKKGAGEVVNTTFDIISNYFR